MPWLAGRDSCLAELDTALAGPAGERRPAPATIAVSGTAGVGKTAVAVSWAHRAAHRFPDGQLYVDLKGFEPFGAPTAPTEALRRLLDALGVAPERIPHSVGARTDLYRSRLADTRTLVVLDNAASAEQVRPLLPGAPGCLVLVTSRNRLASLVAVEGARSVVLDVLSTDAAWELLRRRLGPGRVAAEPAAVDEIVRRCARLPLALAIVAARAVTRPARSLADFAADLRDTDSPLAPFGAGDPATDLRMVFAGSYRTLSAAAARLFRSFGLQPGPDVEPSVLAGTAKLPLWRTRQVVDELVAANLVRERADGRLALSDLLRSYAAELASTGAG